MTSICDALITMAGIRRSVNEVMTHFVTPQWTSLAAEREIEFLRNRAFENQNW